MPISFRCSACGELLSANVAPGEQVRCSECEAVVTVAAVGAPPTAVLGTPMSRPGGPVGSVKSGLAVASLVCGILGVVILCTPVGVAGLIMGIVAVVRANRAPKRYGGKGLAIGGICTGAASILVGLFFLIPFIISLTLPSLGRARELSKRLVCAANLSGIGKSVQIYSYHWNQEFPPDLQVLVDGGDVLGKQFICPSSGAGLSDGIDACYIFLAGQTAISDGRNVLAYEKPENHAGEGANVVFVDGHCEFIEPYSRVEELVAETKRRIAAAKEQQ